MKTGIEIISAERERQILVEGYTAEHDDHYTDGELADASSTYAFAVQFLLFGNSPEEIYEKVFNNGLDTVWPFDAKSLKIPESPIHCLAKAGALIAAEIDRIQRAVGKLQIERNEIDSLEK